LGSRGDDFDGEQGAAISIGDEKYDFDMTLGKGTNSTTYRYVSREGTDRIAIKAMPHVTAMHEIESHLLASEAGGDNIVWQLGVMRDRNCIYTIRPNDRLSGARGPNVMAGLVPAISGQFRDIGDGGRASFFSGSWYYSITECGRSHLRGFATLLVKINPPEPVREAFARDLCIDITKRLLDLKKAGLIDSDLKPENCIIDVDGKFKLIDLGGMVRSDTEGKVDRVPYTPAYGIPEQYSSEQANARTPSFILDIMLAQIGRRKFVPEEKDPPQLAARKVPAGRSPGTRRRRSIQETRNLCWTG